MNKKEMRLFSLKERREDLVETYNNAKADLILNTKKAIAIILDIEEEIKNGEFKIVVKESGETDRIEIELSLNFLDTFIYSVRFFRENLKVDEHFYNPFSLSKRGLTELKEYFKED